MKYIELSTNIIYEENELREHLFIEEINHLGDARESYLDGFHDLGEQLDYMKKIKTMNIEDIIKDLNNNWGWDLELVEKDSLTCPTCGALMKYNIKNNTHIWSCEECPNIMFEYINNDSYNDLGKYLND